MQRSPEPLETSQPNCEAPMDETARLEARVAALEILVETMMGKLYAAHVDFAEEVEELLDPTSFPTGDAKDIIGRARLESAFGAAWDRLLKAREQAALFPREWTRPPRRPSVRLK
jgi:hypothetical protein